MINICRYTESFSEKIKKQFRTVWDEIETHGDVIKETVSVATENGDPVGVCFLMITSSYYFSDLEHPGYLNMEYEALSGADEIEISGVLIDALINDYKKICKKNKNKRLILRTFCTPTSVDYLMYLSSFGFRAQNFMYRMKKDLTEVVPTNGDGSFSFELADGKRTETVEVSAIRADAGGKISGLDGYFEANKSAFGIPDSENELVYRLSEQCGVQFIAGIGGKVVAAVSVWENRPDSVSTENIFCIPEYQRRGVTEKLMRGVCSYLSGKGYREATLFVYGVNTYAVSLYMKLGYDIYGGMLHMLYEDGYVPEMV